MGIQGGPNVPSPTLADIGKDRVWRTRRGANLERHDEAGWTVIARYGSVREAATALDRALAGGADAGTFRVTPQGRGVGTTVLWGAIALAIVAWLVVLYFLLIR
jgi:hypothetical protein